MTKQRLFHRIHGADHWCVPSALSALTGHATDIFRVLQLGIEGRGRGMWQGVRLPTTREMLDAIGIEFDEFNYDGRRKAPTLGRSFTPCSGTTTFNQWCQGRKGYWIVAAGRHMLLFRDGMVVDNGYAASRTPIHYTQVRAKRARMNYALKIDNIDWHDGRVEVPEWAAAAGARLLEERVLNGKSAKIKVAEILQASSGSTRRVRRSPRSRGRSRSRSLRRLPCLRSPSALAAPRRHTVGSSAEAATRRLAGRASSGERFAARTAATGSPRSRGSVTSVLIG